MSICSILGLALSLGIEVGDVNGSVLEKSQSLRDLDAGLNGCSRQRGTLAVCQLDKDGSVCKYEGLLQYTRSRPVAYFIAVV